MPYPIESKIVIAVSASALFDMSESDEIFRREGEESYRAWMRGNAQERLEPGKAFWFVKRFLSLNRGYPEGQGPAEVVLLSRNDPEAGLRVFNSIRQFGLGIVRAAFLDGRSPHPYISAFGASLFLSANAEDVKAAVDAGLPAGLIVSGGFGEDEEGELRVAFDFDGVLAGDEAERVFRSGGDLASFAASELALADRPLDPGPLRDFFAKLAALQEERRRRPAGQGPTLRTAIVTARNAPAHERVVTTLRSWGIFVDEIFFLGGIEKRRILEVFKPHLYFDDQASNLETALPAAACVHVPFGIANT
ncbi:MAG TPA: 5'-nucleotidase [Rectinemataceae bacterium]